MAVKQGPGRCFSQAFGPDVPECALRVGFWVDANNKRRIISEKSVNYEPAGRYPAARAMWIRKSIWRISLTAAASRHGQFLGLDWLVLVEAGPDTMSSGE
jgi:hypothetical protein